MIAQTERLTIHKITLEDAEFIFELMNQPSWLRFIGDRGLRSLEATINYLRDGILKPMRIQTLVYLLSYAKVMVNLWELPV